MPNNNEVINIDPATVNDVLLKRYSNSQMEVIQLEAYVTQLQQENAQLQTELQQLKNMRDKETKEKQDDNLDSGD